MQMKDFAYMQHNGMLGTEPIARFKEWMVKHDYDPEHGKNNPTMTQPGAQSAQTPQPTPSQ